MLFVFLSTRGVISQIMQLRRLVAAPVRIHYVPNKLQGSLNEDCIENMLVVSFAGS